MTQHCEEIEQTRFEKLEAKIDALQRQWLATHITRGTSEEDARPITQEEIEQILKNRRIRDRVIRERDRKILQELNEWMNERMNLIIMKDRIYLALIAASAIIPLSLQFGEK